MEIKTSKLPVYLTVVYKFFDMVRSRDERSKLKKSRWPPQRHPYKLRLFHHVPTDCGLIGLNFFCP
jgi:hypothetical protein